MMSSALPPFLKFLFLSSLVGRTEVGADDVLLFDDEKKPPNYFCVLGGGGRGEFYHNQYCVCSTTGTVKQLYYVLMYSVLLLF